MEVILTECTVNPVKSIERAAANCYDSSPDDNGKIMNNCYNSGHHSVLEFADFTFHISGISRALTHQLVRHRHASYAQRSQRYCVEDGFKYVIPDTIKNNDDKALSIYNDVITHIQLAYKTLTDTYGIPAEDARYLLPNACETVIEVKMNGRELIHFCNERLCTRAQWEIRKLAKKMKACVAGYNDECKKFSSLLVPKCQKCLGYPFCTEYKSCGLAPKLSDVYKAYIKAQERQPSGGEWYE